MCIRDSAQTGNYLFWDLTNSGTPFTLNPGQQITIEFTARIVTIDPARPLLVNTVMTDYNDPFYIPSIGKHPPLSSERSIFPKGKPVVFPNPFNLDTDKEVVFDNVCLLYTSPSPRDRTRSRMPSSA